MGQIGDLRAPGKLLQNAAQKQQASDRVPNTRHTAGEWLDLVFPLISLHRRSGLGPGARLRSAGIPEILQPSDNSRIFFRTRQRADLQCPLNVVLERRRVGRSGVLKLARRNRPRINDQAWVCRRRGWRVGWNHRRIEYFCYLQRPALGVRRNLRFDETVLFRLSAFGLWSRQLPIAAR